MSRPLIPVQCTQFELDLLKMMTRRERRDWPAVFSTNPAGAIWAFVTFSHTPEHLRVDLRGRIDLLDHVSDLIRERSSSGGRFFVSDAGVFLKQNEQEQVIEFFVRENPKRKKVRIPAGARERTRVPAPASEPARVEQDDQALRESLMRENPEFYADLVLGTRPLRRKKRWER